MIEIKNITKTYGNKEVVKNVSLVIEKGKITSFIGANGAGKSTLLSMVSRLLEPSCGEVIIEGKSLKKWKDKELSKKISILRQNNPMDLRLTVKELVSFGRFPHSKGRLSVEDSKHIEKALVYLQLKSMENKYINELSGGQKQRAYIAMILAQDTEYILLDEPLNNLDMKHEVEIMKILRQIVDDFGKTVVIVIHNINFASCYSDKILALQDGEVKYYDDTHEVINSDALSQVFDMEFNVHMVGEQKICTYYKEGLCPYNDQQIIENRTKIS